MEIVNPALTSHFSFQCSVLGCYAMLCNVIMFMSSAYQSALRFMMVMSLGLIVFCVRKLGVDHWQQEGKRCSLFLILLFQ